MIGLFLGDTKFSEIVLNKIKLLKKKYFIIDLSKKNKFYKNRYTYRINIGRFGKILRLIKEKKSKKVLFAGKIDKPNFSSLKLDLKGVYYMPNIIKAAKKGDAAIIKSIIKILNNEDIEVISSIYFNPELTLKSGNYTRTKPNKNDLISIKKGIKYFKKLDDFDHVQALIVHGSKIIAREGREGTKKMIAKLKKKTQGVLIKFPKKKQDLRVDLPTIGLETIKDCKKFGLSGIVLKSKKNIIIDKAKCIKFANKNGIFIEVA